MRRWAGALLLTGLLATACSGTGEETAVARRDKPERSEPVKITGVVERTETFVDPSRPTGPPIGTPDRTLVTTIRFPDAGGPYPLIVMAHGLSGHPRKFAELTDAWARAGYVVALPAFPLTNDDVEPIVISDYENQPADVSFVIDQLVELGRDPGHPLHDRVDPDRIGVAGLSVGAVTTFAVTYNTCCRDSRIDAAITMEGAHFQYEGEYEVVDVPLLLFHGDADQLLPYSDSAEAYAEAEPPKFFVTILGGGHSPPFEDTDDPADAMVTAVTTDFWNLYLTGRRGVIDQLVAHASVPGLSTIQYEAG
jgi:predicted dienelactone hydrolase